MKIIPSVPKKLEFLNLRNEPEKIERFSSVICQIKDQSLPFYFLRVMKLYDEWWRCSRCYKKVCLVKNQK